MDVIFYSSLIRNARRSIGLSQRQFAEKLGITQGAVGAWETGRTQPSFEMVYKMIHELHVSPDVLFGITKQTNQNPN